jgi:hypothetical protein
MRLRKPFTLLTLFLLVSLACQVVPTPPPLKSTLRPRFTPTTTSLPPTASPTMPVVALTPAATSAPSDLPPFPYRSDQPFPAVELVDWQAGSLAATADTPLPASLAQVENLAVTAGLTMRQRALLAEQGFVVIHSQEAQFGDIRQRVALRYGQPYYLTTDAAYHSLDLSLDELLAALEREELHRRLTDVIGATLKETLSYLPIVQGGTLEADVRLAAAYLGVALKLLDPAAVLNEAIDAPVMAQVEQVLAARGPEEARLIPGFQDDFAAYRPAGHYASNPGLAAYFRGLTWLGRVTFPPDERYPGDTPSRAPLIITLALRRALLPAVNPAEPTPGVTALPGETAPSPTAVMTALAGDRSAAQEWALLQETLAFLLGPSVDFGPPEYAAWMDQVYGRAVTVVGLADAGNWETFLDFANQMAPTQIDPGIALSLGITSPLGSWRFLGQRYRLDDQVLQNLVSGRLNSPERPRLLPSGLDWMAALGSSAARQALEAAGETSYPNYAGRLLSLQEMVLKRYSSAWNATAFDALQYAYLPGMALTGGQYPSYMRLPPWSYKEMNSALGSWTETFQTTQVNLPWIETIERESPPASGPPPAYVEPNPQAFYRLSYLANAVADGLNRRGLSGVFSAASPAGNAGEGPGPQASLNALLLDMLDLGDRLRRLGDIAAAELQGHSPEAGERALILAPLGSAEERLERARQAAAVSQMQMPLVPAIAAIPGAGKNSLEVGLGYVDRIYVLVPIDGSLQVAQGGVFSYYEFPQLPSGPLSDGEWQRLLTDQPPSPPAWTSSLYLPEGNPVDVLAFRAGDIYIITPAAGTLNMHASPDRFAKIVRRLRPGEYVRFEEGPLQSGGLTWWKMSFDLQADQPQEGWAVLDPAWYERAWGG